MSVVDQIILDLASRDIPRQVAAMEQASTVFGRLATAAVEALEAGPNRFLIAERLHALGSTTVPHLQKVLRTTTVAEVKTLAAIVLLQLKDRSGVPVLLAAVEEGAHYVALCASHLATADVAEAEAAIVARLERARLEEVDLIVSLVLALNAMNRKLPTTLVSRFSEETVPWQIRTLL